MAPGEWRSVEREDKGIILWDAKSTKAKTGTHYEAAEGELTFKPHEGKKGIRWFKAHIIDIMKGDGDSGSGKEEGGEDGSTGGSSDTLSHSS